MSTLAATESAAISEIGKLPTLGWSSRLFGANIDVNLIRSQARAMIDSGMAKAGYRYVIIDEGWAGGTDEEGLIVPNPSKFSDMRRFIEELKAAGLRVGLYVSAGTGIGGIGGANLQANCDRICRQWGVEFLSIGDIQDEQTAREIHKAVRETGEPVLIDIRSNGFPGEWIAEAANQWNLFEDLQPKFFDLSRNKLDNVVGNKLEEDDELRSVTRERALLSGPGHFYNVGNIPIGKGMQTNQDQAIFSLYCVLGCPIITDIDLITMSNETRDILVQQDALAVHQDPLGAPGSIARYYDPWHCLYSKPLADGTSAFLLFNRCHNGKNLTLEHELDLNHHVKFELYDILNHTFLGPVSKTYQIYTQTSDIPSAPCCYFYKVTLIGESVKQ